MKLGDNPGHIAGLQLWWGGNVDLPPLLPGEGGDSEENGERKVLTVSMVTRSVLLSSTQVHRLHRLHRVNIYILIPTKNYVVIEILGASHPSF